LSASSAQIFDATRRVGQLEDLRITLPAMGSDVLQQQLVITR